MPNEDLISLSDARLKHARECLKEAQILFDADEYKGTANRAYYAAFHSLRAVLILDGFDSKKHSGIISKFRELYLKTELFDKNISDAISALFRVRSSSDYDDFYLITRQDAISMLNYATSIVNMIAEYLNKQH